MSLVTFISLTLVTPTVLCGDLEAHCSSMQLYTWRYGHPNILIYVAVNKGSLKISFEVAFAGEWIFNGDLEFSNLVYSCVQHLSLFGTPFNHDMVLAKGPNKIDGHIQKTVFLASRVRGWVTRIKETVR